VKNRKVAGLNVAISGQKSEHLIGQARDLIAKIEANPEVRQFLSLLKPLL
jgi:hypothetical protein